MHVREIRSPEHAALAEATVAAYRALPGGGPRPGRWRGVRRRRALGSVLCAAVLAGCVAEPSGGDVAAGPVAWVARTVEEGSARVTVVIAAPVPPSQALRGDGEIDFAGRSARLLGYRSTRPEPHGEVIWHGDDAFVTSRFFPGESLWLRLDRDGVAGPLEFQFLDPGTSDPWRSLRALRDSEDPVERLGESSMFGEDVTVWRTTARLDALMAEPPEGHVDHRAPVWAWIDEAGRVRRVVSAIQVGMLLGADPQPEPTEAPGPSALEHPERLAEDPADGVARIYSVVEFRDFGAGVDVDPPADHVEEYEDWREKLRPRRHPHEPGGGAP